MIKKVEELLNEKISIKQKEFSYSLIPNALPMLGVKIPELRKIGKDICNDDYISFLNVVPETFEMEWLKGFVIGNAKMDLIDKFKYLDEFIPTIKDWAVCDGLVSCLKWSKKYPKDMFNYILKYKNSRNEFEVRFVSVMLMSYYLNDEYVDKLFNIIDELYLNDYYAKMGVAWFLATALAKYPDITIKYLSENKLDNWTINKAISKSRESYRIPKDIKDYILRFKS